MNNEYIFSFYNEKKLKECDELGISWHTNL